MTIVTLSFQTESMKSRTEWQQYESLHMYLFANLWTGFLLYAVVVTLVR